MGAIIDLEELPVTDSIEFLRERMLTAPVPLILEPHRDAAAITAHTRVAELGAVHLLSTRSSGADVVRTTRLARDSSCPSLLVSVLGQGRGTIVRGNRVTSVQAGDIGLYVTDQPYRLEFTPGAVRHTFQIALTDLGLTRQLIDSQIDAPIRPDDALTAAVAAFLQSAARNATGASSTQHAALEAPILDLVRLLLTRTVAVRPVGREAAAASLATRIEEHVRSRLDDPGLSARTIALAFSISERYVYTILARRGLELGELLRRRRLERAIRMLEDPAPVPPTIATVAHRCGFADHAHFARVFRAQYGRTPSEWRRDAVARNG